MYENELKHSATSSASIFENDLTANLVKLNYSAKMFNCKCCIQLF